MMFCPYCGANNPEEAACCSGCGSTLPHSQQPTKQDPLYNPDESAKFNKETEKHAKITLALGGISLLLCYWLIGIPFGAAAIGWRYYTKKRGYLGNFADIGMVCGIVAIVLSLVFALFLKIRFYTFSVH